jgi:hypothetical protein
MTDDTGSGAVASGKRRRISNPVARDRGPVRSASRRAFSPQNFGTMSLDERNHWLNRLLALSDRSGRNIAIWKAEVHGVLRGNPIFGELLNEIGRVAVPARTRQRGTEEQIEGNKTDQGNKSDQKLQEIELEIREILDAAIRAVSNTPISLDETVRTQITQLTHEAVLTSPLARIVRWGVPFLLVVIFGGTAFGIWKFQGAVKLTENAAVEAQAKIDNKSAEINGYITQKSGEIGSIAAQATTLIQAADTKVRNASEEITTLEDEAVEMVENIEAERGNTLAAIEKTNELAGKVANLESKAVIIERKLESNQNIVDARWRFNNVLGMVPEAQRDVVLTTTFWTTWLFNGVALLALGLSIWTLLRRRV